MLGTWTRGGWMEGADESTELWRHPIPWRRDQLWSRTLVFIAVNYVVVKMFCNFGPWKLRHDNNNQRIKADFIYGIKCSTFIYVCLHHKIIKQVWLNIKYKYFIWKRIIRSAHWLQTLTSDVQVLFEHNLNFVSISLWIASSSLPKQRLVMPWIVENFLW